MYTTFELPREAGPHEAEVRCMLPDPLDPDSPYDFPVIATRRRLIRLALVAAETGARFQREGMDHDPMAWMLASRELFDGRDAVEAALELQHCTRAILLHGLGLGLDADPAVIDDLCTDDPPETCTTT